MGRWLLIVMIAGALSGCAGLYAKGVPLEAPERYAFHRVEAGDDLAIYWNILRQDGQVVAEGYVENVDGPGNPIQYVDLTLEGLGAEGRVVSKATGVPSPDYLDVGDQGIFRITMSATGQEQDFIIRARYWWEPDPQDGPGDGGMK